MGLLSNTAILLSTGNKYNSSLYDSSARGAIPVQVYAWMESKLAIFWDLVFEVFHSSQNRLNNTKRSGGTRKPVAGSEEQRRDTVFSYFNVFHSVRKEDVRKLANSERKDQHVHLFLETAESKDRRKSSRKRISRAVCGRIILPIRRKSEKLATALHP